MTTPEMTVYGPDGRAFVPFDELSRHADRLAELTRKLRKGQATAEEIAELDRLLDGPA